MAQVALRWVLEQQDITAVIVGAKSADQLRDNLACSDWKMPADELAKLNEISLLPPRYPLSMEATMHQRRANAVNMPTLAD